MGFLTFCVYSVYNVWPFSYLYTTYIEPFPFLSPHHVLFPCIPVSSHCSSWWFCFYFHVRCRDTILWIYVELRSCIWEKSYDTCLTLASFVLNDHLQSHAFFCKQGSFILLTYMPLSLYSFLCCWTSSLVPYLVILHGGTINNDVQEFLWKTDPESWEPCGRSIFS